MNEQIKELEKQATLTTYDIDGFYTGHRFSAEKFAELLIKKCGNFTDPVTRNLMFKYFGVEELGDSSCPDCGADGGTQCGSINCSY